MNKIADLTIDSVVDASGLNCPLPILRARKALLALRAGQVLQVIATDPTSADDFPIFAKATGNTLLSMEQEGEQWIYYLKVNSND